MSETKIPARSELDPQFTWATTDLFPSDGAWEAEIPEIQKLIEQLKAWPGHPGPQRPGSAGLFEAGGPVHLEGRALRMLRHVPEGPGHPGSPGPEDERPDDEPAHPGGRGHRLCHPGDFGDPPGGHGPVLSGGAPGLEHYRLALTRIRRQKDHTLSPREEALLASAGKIGQSPSTIYNLLNDADLSFPDAVDQDGQQAPCHPGHLYPPGAIR